MRGGGGGWRGLLCLRFDQNTKKVQNCVMDYKYLALKCFIFTFYFGFIGSSPEFIFVCILLSYF